MQEANVTTAIDEVSAETAGAVTAAGVDNTWGLACMFRGRMSPVSGIIMIEFTRQPASVNRVNVLVCSDPKTITEIELNRPWLEVQYELIKRSMNAQDKMEEVMQRLIDNINRAGSNPSWQEQLQTWAEAEYTDALVAEFLRHIRSILDIDFKLQFQYFSSLAALAGQFKGGDAVAGETDLGLLPGKRVIGVTTLNDPFRGTMVAELGAAEEIFIRVTDTSSLGEEICSQLGGIDAEGNLIPVCAPVYSVKPLDDRGNVALLVKLGDWVVGRADIYKSVKVKTLSSITRESHAAAADAEARVNSEVFLWIVIIGCIALLAGSIWFFSSLL